MAVPDIGQEGADAFGGDFGAVFEAIRADAQNAAYTERGIDPLYSASAEARMVVIGQAPGRIAQDSGVPWNDKSGDRLRSWLGVDRETFYDARKVAIVPMDFYFPGSGKSGDLPPRRGFAQKWHPVLLGMMPHVRLTVLVGSYAVHRYLGLKGSLDAEEPVVRGGGRARVAGGGALGPGGVARRWLRARAGEKCAACRVVPRSLPVPGPRPNCADVTFLGMFRARGGRAARRGRQSGHGGACPHAVPLTATSLGVSLGELSL